RKAGKGADAQHAKHLYTAAERPVLRPDAAWAGLRAGNVGAPLRNGCERVRELLQQGRQQDRRRVRQGRGGDAGRGDHRMKTMASARRQLGQATIGYSIVVIMVVIVLIARPAVVEELLTALPDAYEAFIYAISWS